MNIKEFIISRYLFLITPNFSLNVDVDSFTRAPTLFDYFITMPGMFIILLIEEVKKCI